MIYILIERKIYSTNSNLEEVNMKSRLLLITLFTFAFLINGKDDYAQNGWSIKTHTLSIRSATSSCAIDGKIYVIGGLGSNATPNLAKNEVYDPSTNTWEIKEPMKVPRGCLSSAVVDGIIYAIGGPHQAPSTILEAYNPASNTWTTKQNMLNPSQQAQACVVNGIIYNIGGNHDKRNCEAYDPVTDTWTAKTPIPEGAGGNAAVTAYNGLIYVFGGGFSIESSTLGPHSKVYAYDPLTDTWTQKQSMPTARFNFQTYLVNDKIYAIGGSQSRGTSLATVEMYDPAADSWIKLNDMPQKLAWHSGVVMNNKIYVICGSTNWLVSDGAVWEYNPDFTGIDSGNVEEQAIPKKFGLNQNYPNPFNPTTNFEFRIAEYGFVSLKIFDVLGRDLITLINEEKPAGEYKIRFSGNNLAGGEYFYQLNAGDFISTKKFVLLK
jgi:N-acetylneuraminic acid mutarotase